MKYDVLYLQDAMTLGGILIQRLHFDVLTSKTPANLYGLLKPHFAPTEYQYPTSPGDPSKTVALDSVDLDNPVNPLSSTCIFLKPISVLF